MSRAKLTRVLAWNVRGTRVGTRGLSEPGIRRSLFRILKENALCSIATVSGKNRAHINTAYFCYSDDLELYFLSHPNSLHCRNLARSSFIGMTISFSSQPWGSPGRGVQLFGRCRQATGLHRRRAERLYAKRFPAYRSWRATVKNGDAGSDYRFYRVVVRTLKILDEQALGDAMFVSATVKRGRGGR